MVYTTKMVILGNGIGWIITKSSIPGRLGAEKPAETRWFFMMHGDGTTRAYVPDCPARSTRIQSWDMTGSLMKSIIYKLGIFHENWNHWPGVRFKPRRRLMSWEMGDLTSWWGDSKEPSLVQVMGMGHVTYEFTNWNQHPTVPRFHGFDQNCRGYIPTYKAYNHVFFAEPPLHRQVVSEFVWKVGYSQRLLGGLEHEFYFYWECHNPNWRTHIFQGGWYTTNQKNNFNSENDENPLIHWKWGYFQTDPSLASS